MGKFKGVRKLGIPRAPRGMASNEAIVKPLIVMDQRRQPIEDKRTDNAEFNTIKNFLGEHVSCGE
jgi:hypothetical protein